MKPLIRIRIPIVLAHWIQTTLKPTRILNIGRKFKINDLPEYKGVLLIILDDDEREFLLLEVQLGDLGPEEEADLGLALVHQDPSGGQAQAADIRVGNLGSYLQTEV